jgi:tetratricopeptide (TPR) repeat protein
VLYADIGRCAEAISILDRVQTDNSWWVEAKIHLGDCKIKMKRYREAIDCYLSITSSAKSMDPIYRKTALRNIGCVYYYLGEYEKAIEHLTKVEDGYDDRPDLRASCLLF